MKSSRKQLKSLVWGIKNTLQSTEKGIEQRLTGRRHETEDISTFNWVRGKRNNFHLCWPWHRERRKGVLWGHKACFKHGSICCDFHDCRNHHPVEAMRISSNTSNKIMLLVVVLVKEARFSLIIIFWSVVLTRNLGKICQ
jgi:hypothetical protein